MRRSNQSNAPIAKESHSEALVSKLELTLTPTSILILTLRMVELTKIRNIIQEMLREHHELSTSVRHLVKAPTVLVELPPIQ